MSLQRCTLSWQAFTTCASHAMSTEKQEIMGLLLGRWDDGSGRDGRSCPTVIVDHAMILSRTDKRRDRVEVGYKQLAEAADIAERISAQLGQVTRVVGWYHSHPHITVLPSHVDVRTQGQYQHMDKRFIGLIFSVFSEDKHSKVGTIEVTAFQARNTSDAMDLDEGIGAGAGRGQLGGGGGWERTEVALSFHGPGSGSSTTPLSDALERVVRLQDTLFGEERAGYLAALGQDGVTAREEEEEEEEEDSQPLGSSHDRKTARTRGQGADLLSKLFCSAVYSKSLAALSGDSAVPLAQTLRSQLKILQNRAAALEQRRAKLRSALNPAEFAEAVSSARAKLREPCSAGIGAFQAKHEGELDIPRADALRFAREGAPLRRHVILKSTNTVIMVRIFREYPGQRTGQETAATTTTTAAASSATSSSHIWHEGSASAGGVETSRNGEAGGGLWVVDLGGKVKTLVGLRAGESAGEGFFRRGVSGSNSRKRELVVETREHGEEILICDDQQSFRMWLGVAAAVFPSSTSAAAGGGDIE